MHTDFQVLIQDPREAYAGQAVREAFGEVDRLENLLSRFIENSEVSQINSLSLGQEIMLDEDTLRCLQIARRAWQLTEGVFDVTVGHVIAAWKEGDVQMARSLLTNRPSMEMIELNAQNFTVAVAGGGVSLDLGGIGKGYAVDKIAEVLSEWGLDKALIHSGASSILALNPPVEKNGWPITLTNPVDLKTITRLEIKNEVLSCSGLQGGEHIIDPFTGLAVADRRACWIRLKENAALADALTTAGMIMPVDQYPFLREALSDMSIMVLITPEGQPPELIRFGL